MRYSFFFLLLLSSCTYNEIIIVCEPEEEIYINLVEPIIESSCVGCHHESSMNASILTTYEGVVDAVKNHELVNLVVSEQMPLGGVPKLTQYQIDIIQNWANCE
tara:strand:+ start:152 stop:463 length:312 start_codon:yes stop_codon:yes gene_type:complete